ncbi:hypothetical protein [Consotaella aegiceratis]|uniref:hypothetical protein n=1 Tax=Consotaella aegiceratis TaxID=3097961 RepID=UPI002F3F6333
MRHVVAGLGTSTKTVQLSVVRTSDKAISFYRKFGFSVIGEEIVEALGSARLDCLVSSGV